jgi:hypothetical protein
MLLALLLSCVKHVAPEPLMDNTDCVASLKQKLDENNCFELAYSTRDYSDILMRCHKPDPQRANMWDTNWFRISKINVIYTQAEMTFIDKHTICLDSYWRVESYKPENVAAGENK